VQVWGAGGGSGHQRGASHGGSGGGSAFVEAVLLTTPGEVLQITVATGGCAGVYGTTADDDAGALVDRQFTAC
jgi:hypothetical protein